jgi:hypothetical protein
MSENLAQRCYAALNRLTKWRTIFAGWQLGTRAKGDPESDAVRDHREVTILLRAEVSALSKILLDKGVMTEEDFQHGMIEEAEMLSKDYEKKFPGCKATDIGIQMDVSKVKEYMKDWRP